MEKLKALVLRHSVFVFYTVTYAISWGGLLLLVGGPKGITTQATDIPFFPLYLVTVAGPSLAGVLMVYLYQGRTGFRELLSSMFKWKVSLAWYAAALFTAPLSVFSVLFALSQSSSVFIPGIFDSGNNPLASMFGIPSASASKVSLLLIILLLGLFNGFVEELGWTGFAIPRLRMNYNLIVTGLIAGIMWGLWHFPSNYIGSAAGAGTLPLFIFMPSILFSFLIPYRMIMVWVFEHTKSLLIAILMHASLDVFWLISTPLSITGNQRVVWYAIWTAILWIMFLITTIIPNKKLPI